jgi:hypothetical protein
MAEGDHEFNEYHAPGVRSKPLMKSITVTQHKLASNDLSNNIRSTGGPVHNDTSGFEGKLGEIRELSKIIKNKHALSIMKTLERRHFIDMIVCSITKQDNIDQQLLSVFWKLDLPISEELFDVHTVNRLNRLRQPVYDLHSIHTSLGKPISIDFVDVLSSVLPHSAIAQQSTLQQAVIILARFLRQLMNDDRANVRVWPDQWQARGEMFPRMIIQTVGMHDNISEIYTKCYSRTEQTCSYSVQYRDRANTIQYEDILAIFQSISDDQHYLHAIINKYPVKGTKITTGELLLQATNDVYDVIQSENIVRKVIFMKVNDPIRYSLRDSYDRVVFSQASYRTVINYK